MIDAISHLTSKHMVSFSVFLQNTEIYLYFAPIFRRFANLALHIALAPPPISVYVRFSFQHRVGEGRGEVGT